MAVLQLEPGSYAPCMMCGGRKAAVSLDLRRCVPKALRHDVQLCSQCGKTLALKLCRDIAELEAGKDKADAMYALMSGTGMGMDAGKN